MVTTKKTKHKVSPLFSQRSTQFCHQHSEQPVSSCEMSPRRLATSAHNNSTSESASSGARGRLASSSARAATSQGHAPIAIQVYRKGVLENNLRAVNRPHALKDLGKGKPTYVCVSMFPTCHCHPLFRFCQVTIIMAPKKRTAPATGGGGRSKAAKNQNQGNLPPLPPDTRVLPHMKMLDTWMFLGLNLPLGLLSILGNKMFCDQHHFIGPNPSHMFVCLSNDPAKERNCAFQEQDPGHRFGWRAVSSGPFQDSKHTFAVSSLSPLSRTRPWTSTNGWMSTSLKILQSGNLSKRKPTCRDG